MFRSRVAFFALSSDSQTQPGRREECSAFKTLTDQRVIVELKNDLAIEGTLRSVDQFLNLKIDDIKVVDPERHPHLVPFLSFSLSSWSESHRRPR